MKRVICLLLAALFAWSAMFLSAPARMITEAEEAQSAIPDPVDLSKRKDFDFGVNVHPSSYAAYPEVYMEQQIHAVARMGSKWIRFGGAIPEDGDWTYLDTMVGLCNKYGLKIIMVISPSKTMGSEYITTVCESFAHRYNGKDGRGYVDIFQVWNEVDIPLLRAKYGGSSPAGDSESHYYTISVDGADDLPEYLGYFKAAEKGIHSKNSRSQMMINFSAAHCGMITYFLRKGVKIDVVGWDLYVTRRDREEAAQRQVELYDLIEKKIVEPYHLPVMLCETNIDMRLLSESEHQAAELSTYQPVLDNIYLGYARSWLKGAILYELLDEPALSGPAEPRYGLIRNTQGGVGVTDTKNEKPIYRELQKLLGGNSKLKMIKRSAVNLKPYSKLVVETADDSGLSGEGTDNFDFFDGILDSDAGMDIDLSDDVIDEDILPEPEEVIVEKVVNPVKEIREKETLYEMPWLLTILCGVGLLLLAGGAVTATILLDKRKAKKL